MGGKEIWVEGVGGGRERRQERGWHERAGSGEDRTAGAPGALLPFSGFREQKPESTGRSQSRPVSAGAHGKTMPTGRGQPPWGEGGVGIGLGKSDGEREKIRE